MSFIELLSAVLILAVVSAGAAATWSLSSRMPNAKRITEMASLVAVQEIEKIKAQHYLNTSDTTTVSYYDKYGSGRDSSGTLYASAQSKGFKATTVVSVLIDRNGTADSEDLRQVLVTVVSSDDTTKTWEIQRTLIAFGGF